MFTLQGHTGAYHSWAIIIVWSFSEAYPFLSVNRQWFYSQSDSPISGEYFLNGTKTHRKSSDILSLLLDARLVSDKLAPVSSRQAWKDCLGSTFPLSSPVRDWDRWRSPSCSSVRKARKLVITLERLLEQVLCEYWMGLCRWDSKTLTLY